MFLVGSDFAYISNPVRIGQQDKGNFRLIDSLIETLNDHSESKLGYKIQARYSTPSDYFKAIEREIELGHLEIPTLINPDYSQYDEKFHYLHKEFKGVDRVDYWAGYYSNRPAFKSLIYQAFNHFHVTETFINLALMSSADELPFSYTFNKNPFINFPRNDSTLINIYEKRNEISSTLSSIHERISIGTHHDTIPSTSRSSVHDSETAKFKNAIEDSKALLIEEYLTILQAKILFESQS